MLYDGAGVNGRKKDSAVFFLENDRIKKKQQTIFFSFFSVVHTCTIVVL